MKKNTGMFKAWIKALRMPSQLFIFPALLLGEAVYYSLTGIFNWQRFILVHLFGLFMQWYIVFANDYADFETDKLNQDFLIFTGGSRVLVEGDLKPQSLKKASIAMAVSCLLMASLASFLTMRLTPLILTGIGLLLLWFYSFKPVQMSYRGFGETLQMIGVGLFLPLIAFSFHGGAFSTFPLWLAFLTLPGQLAMAISTSLPDVVSDRKSGKKTTVVNLGSKASGALVLLLYGITLNGIFIKSPELFFQRGGLVFFVLGSIILALKTYVYLKHVPMPKTKPLFLFVSLSILLNTVLVFGLSTLIFNGHLI
jgi:1,4-dihydroxy-2-naphthoate polyprenyltransferase